MRSRLSRLFVILLVATTSLLVGAGIGRANARELRDDSARFFMDVTFPGAAVCVVHPEGFADDACRNVSPELSRQKVPPRAAMYAVELPGWEAVVLVMFDANPVHRSLTTDEARVFFDATMKMEEAASPGTEWITEQRRLQRGELTTHQRTLAIPQSGARLIDRLELVTGSESLVMIRVSFPEAHAAEGNDLAERIMSTVQLPPAPPLRTEVAYGALKLLAGVPIVALCGLLRARVRTRGRRK